MPGGRSGLANNSKASRVVPEKSRDVYTLPGYISRVSSTRYTSIVHVGWRYTAATNDGEVEEQCLHRFVSGSNDRYERLSYMQGKVSSSSWAQPYGRRASVIMYVGLETCLDANSHLQITCTLNSRHGQSLARTLFDLRALPTSSLLCSICWRTLEIPSTNFVIKGFAYHGPSLQAMCSLGPKLPS